MSGRIDIRYQLIHLDSVDSTQSYAIRNFNNFIGDTLVVCNLQTAGYGRQHSKWLDSSQNLAFSFVFNYSINLNESFKLAVYIAKALNTVLQRHHLNTLIKWPNDIYLDKKISGMIIDYKDNKVVVGIGINLNEDFHDFAKADLDGDKILLAQEISTEILDTLDEDFQRVLDYCNQYSYLKDKLWHVKGIGEVEVKYLDKFGNLHYNKNNEEHTINVTQFSLKS